MWKREKVTITLDWVDRKSLFEEVTFNWRPKSSEETAMWNCSKSAPDKLTSSEKNFKSQAPFGNCKSHQYRFENFLTKQTLNA